tara:strand:- start:383 stop:646 length:264 start_codon:yes stop_codon:yes gene_type:complete
LPPRLGSLDVDLALPLIEAPPHRIRLLWILLADFGPNVIHYNHFPPDCAYIDRHFCLPRGHVAKWTIARRTISERETFSAAAISRAS